MKNFRLVDVGQSVDDLLCPFANRLFGDQLVVLSLLLNVGRQVSS